MPLTVHHLGVSQSDRVVFLCEELKLDYELKMYKRSPTLAPPEYKALHPLGSAPVIEDSDNGVKLAESGACVEYISQVFGKGRLTVAPGQKGYADYLYWFHFANGSLFPAIMRKMTFMMAGLNTDNPILQRMTGRAGESLKLVDERLGQAPYLAGDELTAADIMTVCCLTSMRCFSPYDLGDYPNILAYLKRVSEREGYRRALQKGDPDLDIEKLIGAPPPPMFEPLAAMLNKSQGTASKQEEKL